MKRFFVSLLILCNSFLTFGQIIYDDGPIILTDSSARLTIDEFKWNSNCISYFFQNGTSDILGDSEQDAIIEAFDLWSNVTPLVFFEVGSANEADIIILWGSGSHGDGYPFDGTNGVLAHAFYPPPNGGGGFEGDIHFDESETWTLNTSNSSSQPIDLITVAAHEIGHSLGLAHSTDPNALMFASYTGSQRFLSLDDIQNIQMIYGNNVSGLSSVQNVCNLQPINIPIYHPCEESASVNWYTSSNIEVVSSNSMSATVQPIENSTSGNGWIKAILSNGVEFIEEFWVGRPIYSNSQIQGTSSQVGLYSSGQLSVSQANGVMSYQWTIVDDYNNCPGSSGPYFWAYGTGTKQVTTSSRYIGINYGLCSGTFRLRCRAINSCGSSYYNDFVVTVGSSSPCTSSIILSPNPSKNGRITLVKTPAPCNLTFGTNAESISMSFTIFDMSGNIVMNGKSKTDIYELDVSQLMKGKYVIHVLTSEKQLLKSTFIIK